MTDQEERGPSSPASETTQAPRRSLRNRIAATPLLPDAGAAGAPLTGVIAIMSFLAVMAMSVLLVTHSTTESWTKELRSELTVQVKGPNRALIEQRTDAILAVLEETPGVVTAKTRSLDDTAALLDPWLGAENAKSFVNLPALIEVRIDSQQTVDLDHLRQEIELAAPEASLDDHASWRGRLENAARSGQMLTVAIFLLVLGAAAAIAVFAARAGLAANRDIVSVLHLVGAEDGFIASEIQRRFFILGLRGALIGFVIALIAIALTAFAINQGAGAFLPQLKLGAFAPLWLTTAPLIICLVTAVTARATVLHTLKRTY